MHKTWNKHNIYVIPSGEQFGFKRDDVVNLIYSPLAGKFFLATEEETKKIKSDLEEDIRALGEELSNPDLYRQNPTRFDEASKLLEEKIKEKASKEEAWLELEILAEELSN